MKPTLPLALFGAILLAGCDSTTTLASTSSETQTSLQELADNVRTAPKSAFSQASVTSAMRAMTAASRMASPIDTQYMGVFTEQSVCEPFQYERFLPPDSSVRSYDLWFSIRLNRPQRMDGTPYHCGDGTPMKLFLQQSTKKLATRILAEYDGWYLRSRNEGYIDSGLFHERMTYPNGFTLEGNLSLGQIDHFNIPHSWHDLRSFDSGKYQFLDTGWLPSPGLREFCSSITDVSKGVQIGTFCWEFDSSGNKTDSVVVRDGSGRRISPRALPVDFRDDSMGLRLQDPTLDRQACTTDSIRLRVWAKTVQAVPELTPARTILSISRSSSSLSRDTIALTEDALGTGTWVDFAILPEGDGTDSILVQLIRTYWPESPYSANNEISLLTIPLSACRKP
jgi:hypothetical protein